MGMLTYIDLIPSVPLLSLPETLIFQQDNVPCNTIQLYCIVQHVHWLVKL